MRRFDALSPHASARKGDDDMTTQQDASAGRSGAATDPAVARRVVEAAIATIDQCAALVERLDDEQYTAPCAAMFGACIGQHVRHAMDHYTAALNAADDAPVDYDMRQRGTDIESDRASAIDLMRAAQRRLLHLGDAAAKPARIRVMLTADDPPAELGSTLARELAFASHHAIHHYAMIAAIASDLGAPMPEGFGKAPSTIKHERALPGEAPQPAESAAG
jgi:uncharacterized damage-inducible protein DinB